MGPKLELPPPMTFPSELREPSSSTRYLEARTPSEIKQEDTTDNNTETITPPPAYTEFLDIFSPIFTHSSNSHTSFAKYMLDKPRRSPTSVPSTATSASFSEDSTRSSTPRSTPTILPAPSPKSPWSAHSPDHSRRLRIPPPYLTSPASTSASPRSAQLVCSPYSPSEWMVRRIESPVSEHGEISVRHVVTTTITFKRAPQLDPPPLGKRRRNAGAKDK